MGYYGQDICSHFDAEVRLFSDSEKLFSKKGENIAIISPLTVILTLLYLSGSNFPESEKNYGLGISLTN